MRQGLTINKAIMATIKEAGEALSPQEVYRRIVEKKLYDFHAQRPERVVVGQIRRHCKDLDFPTAAPTKLFGIARDGKFYVLDQPLLTGRTRRSPKANKDGRREPETRRARETKPTSPTMQVLKELHNRHREDIKKIILHELNRQTPVAFEYFAKQLLGVYGFEDIHVTSVTRDGGIGVTPFR